MRPKRRRSPPRDRMEGHRGRVVEIRGRRVLVRDERGERVCFLSGHRAVVGDRVRWQEARGSGGKIIGIEPREACLARRDMRGKEQVLAANLTGLVVVAAPKSPPFRAGLLDRYLVAGSAVGLEVVVCLNKVDEGVPAKVEASLALRTAAGLECLRVSAHTGEGVQALDERLAGGTWAFVGHSGVGKTSLVAALLPKQEVGPIGDLSEYWGTGQHTTTGSRLFRLLAGGEIIDSPGIRTFTPGRLGSAEVARHFPGLDRLRCRYRNCLHRVQEEGCVAEEQVSAELLQSYRRTLQDVLGIEERSKPG